MFIVTAKEFTISIEMPCSKLEFQASCLWNAGKELPRELLTLWEK